MKKMFAIIAMLFSSSAAFGGAALKYPDLSAEEVDQINNYAEKVVASMQKNANPDFSFDEKSVRFLSEVISNEGKTYSDKAKEMLPTMYGSYLGAAIIKKYDGKWINVEGVGYGVIVDESNISFPFNKVKKHIENGEEDSIYALYMNANNMKKLSVSKKK